MAKNPVLPLYYNDLLGATQDWLDEEFGAYVRLLIYQWDKGFIPSDLMRLKKIADSVEKNWPVLCQKFTPDEQGSLKNPVMEKIRTKRESFLQHQLENGIQGGRPKKITLKKPKLKPKLKPNENPNNKPLEEEIEIELEIEMPFKSELFNSIWQNWKKYRHKELKKDYASNQSEQAALNHLARLSSNREDVACEVINQSIANQWQGLFELKTFVLNSNGDHKNQMVY